MLSAERIDRQEDAPLAQPHIAWRAAAAPEPEGMRTVCRPPVGQGQTAAGQEHVAQAEVAPVNEAAERDFRMLAAIRARDRHQMHPDGPGGRRRPMAAAAHDMARASAMYSTARCRAVSCMTASAARSGSVSTGRTASIVACTTQTSRKVSPVV